MAANTGRTVGRWTEVHLDDSGGTLNKLQGVQSINGVGLDYAEEDVTSFVDACKTALPGTPDCKVELAGVLDTTATVGAHIVLSGVAGLGTPLSFDVRFGVRHAWESGEPQFGITSGAASGVLCTKYVVDGEGKWSASLVVYGVTAPAWGTTAET